MVKITQKNITINRYIRPHPLLQLAADTDDTLAPDPTSTQVQFEKVWNKITQCLCHSEIKPIEPAHEIMVLFVFRKLILQTRMRSYPVELDV